MFKLIALFAVVDEQSKRKSKASATVYIRTTYVFVICSSSIYMFATLQKKRSVSLRRAACEFVSSLSVPRKKLRIIDELGLPSPKKSLIIDKKSLIIGQATVS